MKLFFKSILMSAVLLSALTTQANPEDRKKRQQQRIQEGVQSGQLTPEEAARLQNGQKRVQAVHEAAASDGVISDEEKKKLHKMQNRQSRRIHKQKHDEQKQ